MTAECLPAPGAEWPQAEGAGRIPQCSGRGEIPMGATLHTPLLVPRFSFRRPSWGPSSQWDIQSNQVGVRVGGWPQMAGITSLGPPSLCTKTVLGAEGQDLFPSTASKLPSILVLYGSRLIQWGWQFPVWVWGHLLQVINGLCLTKAPWCPKKRIYRSKTCCVSQYELFHFVLTATL